MSRDMQASSNKQPNPYGLLPVLLLCSVAVVGILFFVDTTQLDAMFAGGGTTQANQASDGTDGTQDENTETRRQVISEQAVTLASTEGETNEEIAKLVNLLHNYSLESGGVFSFKSAVGDFSEDADVQALASALYAAALKADLNIVERNPNPSIIDNVPIGLDAFVSYDSSDLRIENPHAEVVNFDVAVRDNAVVVKILGIPPADGVSIRLVTHIVEPSSSSDGEDGEENESESSYTVESYRVYSKGNEVIENELIATDTYVIS